MKTFLLIFLNRIATIASSLALHIDNFKKGGDVMLNCDDVAKYFLSLSDDSSGDYISNLKLQKLLYYAQGFHLAIFNKPLFNEPIEAWAHGPVVGSSYRKYP